LMMDNNTMAKSVLRIRKLMMDNNTMAKSVLRIRKLMMDNNTMVKRKSTKGQTTIYKTYT
jgi:hypothetical protein